MYTLHPDRQSDLVAVAATRQSSGTGSLNLGALGAYLVNDVGKGIANAGKVTTRIYKKIIDAVTEIDGVDEDWLLNLGRMHSPDDALLFRGRVVNREARAWHPVIAPKGYVDRFEAAVQTAIVFGGGLVLKLLLDSGLGSFIGGQYSSWSTREYRENVLEALNDLEGEAPQTHQLSYNPDDAWVLDFVHSIAHGVGHNNPFTMKATSSQYSRRQSQG